MRWLPVNFNFIAMHCIGDNRNWILVSWIHSRLCSISECICFVLHAKRRHGIQMQSFASVRNTLHKIDLHAKHVWPSDKQTYRLKKVDKTKPRSRQRPETKWTCNWNAGIANERRRCTRNIDSDSCVVRALTSLIALITHRMFGYFIFAVRGDHYSSFGMPQSCCMQEIAVVIYTSHTHTHTYQMTPRTHSWLGVRGCVVPLRFGHILIQCDHIIHFGSDFLHQCARFRLAFSIPRTLRMLHFIKLLFRNTLHSRLGGT